MKEVMKDDQCKEQVYERTGFGNFYQCQRKVWKDGYCKQHHPDSVAERKKAIDRRYEEKKKKSSWYRLQIALDRIKELESEISRLKAEVLR